MLILADTAELEIEIDIEEIEVDNSAWSERARPSSPSFLAHHRACIRLFMVLERVLSKINIPSCTLSSAIDRISSSVRRRKETIMHGDDCGANHGPLSFDEELARESPGLETRRDCDTTEECSARSVPL